MGNHAKAIEYFEKGINIGEKNNVDVSLTYCGLARVYEKQDNYELAETYYKKGLQSSLTFATPNLNFAAICLSNLGMLYKKQKRYSEALELLEAAIHKCEKLPDAKIVLAALYNNIGQIYHALSDYDKAIEYLNKTLEIQQHIYPSLHPEFANTYNNIANAYYKQNMLSVALQYREKAYEIHSLYLPATNPQLISEKESIEEMRSDIAQALLYEELMNVFGNIFSASKSSSSSDDDE